MLRNPLLWVLFDILFSRFTTRLCSVTFNSICYWFRKSLHIFNGIFLFTRLKPFLRSYIITIDVQLQSRTNFLGNARPKTRILPRELIHEWCILSHRSWIRSSLSVTSILNVIKIVQPFNRDEVINIQKCSHL